MPINGIEFDLDIGQSEIRGFLSHSEPTCLPSWSIRVECGPARLLLLEDESEEDLRERREWVEFVSGEGCHAEISGLSLPVKSWHDLAGQRVSAEFEHSHPMMPDDPGEFYFEAHHMVANRNQIEFGTRQNNSFPIRWTFEAEESDEEYDDEVRGMEVEVEANIPFRRFVVWFENSSELNFEAAVRAVSRYASEDELGEPSEQLGHYVMIPLLGGDQAETNESSQ
jgi:hypothetical protein